MNNPSIRNWHAVAAHHRHGGPMKDRRAPRGGDRNHQQEHLQELYLVQETTEDDTIVLAQSSSL